jgi:hypothetical protein
MIVFLVTRRVSPFAIHWQDSGSGDGGDGEAAAEPKRTDIKLSQPITAAISS